MNSKNAIIKPKAMVPTVQWLLPHCLIKLANLTIRDEQIVKATIGEIKYELAISKLIKIFFWHFDMSSSKLSTLNIKPEPTFHAQNHPVDHQPTYNQDSEEDCDYQNQEVLTES